MNGREILLAGLALLLLGDASAAISTVVKETLSHTEVCGLSPCVQTARRSKMVLKNTTDWVFPILENVDSETTVSVTFGEFEFERPLSEAAGYEEGDTKATFYDVVSSGGGKETKVLKLTVTWANQRTTLKAMIVDENGFADSFLNSTDGEHSQIAPVIYEITPSDLNGISVYAGVSAVVKVKHQQKDKGDETTVRTRVALKGKL